MKDGKEVDSESLINDVLKYKSYMQFSGGGITISGGEPLLQPEFVMDMFKKCKANGIHTALDTSGFVKIETADPVLDYTDLVLLDIKSINPKVFKDLTGVPLDPTLAFANHLKERQIPIWLRYVLVPGLTDNPEDIEQLAKHLTTLTNIQRIDLLPFHKMGEYKWSQLDYEYALTHTPQPTRQQVLDAKAIFQKYNLPIHMG
jgi:pyruvate formate lyase activating enzyme